MTMDWKIHACGNIRSPQVISVFNVISIKITGIQIVKTSFKKNKFEVFTLAYMSTYYKSTVWYWLKHRQIDQWNRTAEQSSDTDPHIC